MSWGEEQKKEIETIRERKITGGVMYVEYKNGEVRECQK